jgi:DNA-binding Lrp family transcriptional regulator
VSASKVVAYVLIVTDVGKEHDIADELLKINGVVRTNVVYGEFDVIAEINCPDLKSLDQTVTKLRKNATVIRTSTLISS